MEMVVTDMWDPVALFAVAAEDQADWFAWCSFCDI